MHEEQQLAAIAATRATEAQGTTSGGEADRGDEAGRDQGRLEGGLEAPGGGRPEVERFAEETSRAKHAAVESLRYLESREHFACQGK